MEGPTGLQDARQSASPVSAWAFDLQPKYQQSSTGNQPGATPGWPADGDHAHCGSNEGHLCRHGWPRPTSPFRDGWSDNQGGWGPSRVERDEHSGWVSTGRQRDQPAADAQDEHDEQLEGASTPPRNGPGSISPPRRPGEGGINARAMLNTGQGRAPFQPTCVNSWGNPAIQRNDAGGRRSSMEEQLLASHGIAEAPEHGDGGERAGAKGVRRKALAAHPEHARSHGIDEP